MRVDGAVTWPHVSGMIRGGEGSEPLASAKAMKTEKLTGHEAIDYAERTGVKLHNTTEKTHCAPNQEPKTTARIFQEPTGLWHYCDDELPHLDARGEGYKSRASARRAAREAGYRKCL